MPTTVQGFPVLVEREVQGAAIPLPEREVPSHPSPFLPPKAGQKEHWKALTIMDEA